MEDGNYGKFDPVNLFLSIYQIASRCAQLTTGSLHEVTGSYWFYAPNKGGPIFFAIAFLASGALHAWQS